METMVAPHWITVGIKWVNIYKALRTIPGIKCFLGPLKHVPIASAKLKIYPCPSISISSAQAFYLCWECPASPSASSLSTRLKQPLHNTLLSAPAPAAQGDEIPPFPAGWGWGCWRTLFVSLEWSSVLDLFTLPTPTSRAPQKQGCSGVFFPNLPSLWT